MLLVLLLAALTLGTQAPPPRLTPANVGGLVEAWRFDTREWTLPGPSSTQETRLRGDAVCADRPALSVDAGRPP